MQVSVVGLGYVGAVTAACLAEAGHTVHGVDVSAHKVDTLNCGRGPVQERDLDALVQRNLELGRLRATGDLASAVNLSEVVVITVGTPSGADGDVDLSHVVRVCDEVGLLLADCDDYKVVVLTSTVPPGTLDDVVRPRLEKRSGKVAGVDFGVCFVPEFLREGTAVADFTRPSPVIVGCSDVRSQAVLEDVFEPLQRPVEPTVPAVAELAKFTSNAWHALKVTFANEIGRIAAHAGVDSHEVMELFKGDTRLNVSASYLTPGFSFGGSCLPKDLRTLTYRAQTNGTDVPVLNAILPSNQANLDAAVELIERRRRGNVLLLGLAFKANTDDLRESPAVPLAATLLSRGCPVRIYDDHVRPGHLDGANRAFAHDRLPQLAAVLGSDLTEELAGAETIVITQWNHRFADAFGTLPASSTIIDLTGVGRGVPTDAVYVGLSW